MTESTDQGTEVRPANDVEVSVVGSPEVFGTGRGSSASSAVVVETTISPQSDDERLIERCDLLGIPSSAAGVDAASDAARLLKKRAHSPRLLSASGMPPIVAMTTPFLSPAGEALHSALSQWEWVTIDGTRMPAVTRNGEKYLAVHIVQLKLLSKFPPNIPAEMTSRFTMVSHKMLAVEAWIFNAVNAVMCRFDCGCQIFSPVDEVVKYADVLTFYWNVKSLNLKRLILMYKQELEANACSNLTLMATITQLKKAVEADLELAQEQLQRLPLAEVPCGSPNLSLNNNSHDSSDINVY